MLIVVSNSRQSAKAVLTSLLTCDWHKSQSQLHPDHRRPKGVGRVARAPRAVGHDGLAPLGRNGRHGGGLQLREARDEARDDLGSVCREVVVLARVFLDVEEARRLRRQGATAT